MGSEASVMVKRFIDRKFSMPFRVERVANESVECSSVPIATHFGRRCTQPGTGYISHTGLI